MPSNDNVSKVIYGGRTLIDLTNDTVTESDVINARTFHKADGSIVTGTCTYDADTSDGTAIASEVLDTKTAYVNGAKVTGNMPNRGAVEGFISTKEGTYTIPNGYHDGSGYVGINTTEKAKLVAENIRQGINLLGVEGSMSGLEDVVAESKTITPYTTQQVVTPAAGYNYMSQVTVNAISYSETQNPTGGITVTIGDVAPVSSP